MAEKDFLTYKGYPLVRKDDVIYYGNMGDKYVIRMTVLSKQKDIAEKIRVELMLSDITLNEKDRIAKSSERTGFYEAMDIASIWLARFNKE